MALEDEIETHLRESLRGERRNRGLTVTLTATTALASAVAGLMAASDRFLPLAVAGVALVPAVAVTLVGVLDGEAKARGYGTRARRLESLRVRLKYEGAPEPEIAKAFREEIQAEIPATEDRRPPSGHLSPTGPRPR